MAMYPDIEKCILFKGLSLEEVEEVLSKVVFKEKTFQKNDFIAYSGTEVREMLILAKGSVKGEMTDMSGKTIKIEDIDSPRVLAPAFVYGGNNRFPVDIVAKGPSTVIAISKSLFTSLLQRNEKILINYLNSISNRAQFLSTKLKFLSFKTLQGKIAHYILQESLKNKTKNLRLTKSQNELAEIFGVARPSLGRTMRELHDVGILRVEGKEISILDETGLKALINK